MMGRLEAIALSHLSRWSNYALERSVTALSKRAAGAQNIVAPAARWNGFARPAQRGR
jgi:hypothetical protein